MGHPETVTSPGARIRGCRSRPSPQKNRISPSQPAHTHESVSKLRGHQIVEDWVDGRVEIQHGSTKVQDVVVTLYAEAMNLLRGHKYEPDGKYPEGNETDKERENDGAQHEDHLLSGTRVGTFQILDSRCDGICH
ncbi:hypothetical protein L798_03970 [Zootermopsis nevadensis]|uniref:Uncharacterized protein n=1 Tax=Zootermopsis nevadensis TaxID=136037 RepID=A0A067RC52_ZOONE|nr:hypothetical protein L798_03970 [Zootermopsis nevadensis]